MRRSSWPRRNTWFTCSLSVKMSVAPSPALVLVAQAAELDVEVALARLGGVRRHHAHVVAQHDARARRQPQAIARPALLHRLGRVAEVDDGLAHDVVQAQIAEREGVALDLRRQPRSSLAATQTAHLEEVRKVGVEVQVEHKLDVVVMEVAHAQQLVQAVGEKARASHVHARLRQRVPVRGTRLQVGELHRGRVAALGRGREEHRLAAGDRELVPAQVAGVVMEEAEHRVLATQRLAAARRCTGRGRPP